MSTIEFILVILIIINFKYKMAKIRKESIIFESKINKDNDSNDNQMNKQENNKSNIQLKEEFVNHPSHYTWLQRKCGIEVIDLCENFDFCIGNALKYILRAGHKQEEGKTSREKRIEDLKKAVWYLNYKINKLERE